MAALDFPENPYEGQIYSQNGKSWRWTGVCWESYNESVVNKAIRIIEGEYLIDKDDGVTVCLSGEGEKTGYIILTESSDDEIRPGFRFEMWRVNAAIGFEVQGGIRLIAPEGSWVDRLGGRGVVMKIAERTWMMTGDLGETPDSQIIETESNDPITTDN